MGRMVDSKYYENTSTHLVIKNNTSLDVYEIKYTYLWKKNTFF